MRNKINMALLEQCLSDALYWKENSDTGVADYRTVDALLDDFNSSAFLVATKV